MGDTCTSYGGSSDRWVSLGLLRSAGNKDDWVGVTRITAGITGDDDDETEDVINVIELLVHTRKRID